MYSDLLWLDCPDCGDVQAFERPACGDGAEAEGGAAGDEWCCTVCGAAVLEWTASVRVTGRARRRLRGAA